MLTLRRAIYSKNDLRFLSKILLDGLDRNCLSGFDYKPSDCKTCEHRHICHAINQLSDYALKRADEIENEKG